MNAKHLLDLVSRYKENREFINNEESTKMALIVPFIRCLGYDANSPREVRFEYTAEFTHGDGKRHADRMDYAIFDQTGTKPLMVIEAKPLGSNLDVRSPQLARYIAQMADLHFGILTDGCRYLFFGDLENPNQMDRDAFFSFSLANESEDWNRVGEFLSKFSREAFNAETLVTDAENSRYRQGMIAKLSTTLKNPAADDGFLRWLTEDVYKGKRTAGVMQRLGEIAQEAIEPALITVLEDDFVDQLRQRFQKVRDTHKEVPPDEVETVVIPADEPVGRKSSIETTEEELAFYDAVKRICIDAGADPEQILHKDTSNYFNVSYRRPTKWFIRFFGDSRRKAIVTPVPVDEAKELIGETEFVVEPSPSVFGTSRIYITSGADVARLRDLIIRSWQICQSPDEPTAESQPVESP